MNANANSPDMLSQERAATSSPLLLLASLSCAIQGSTELAAVPLVLGHKDDTDTRERCASAI
eukprot:3062134-Amphidinium_carterae.1